MITTVTGQFWRSIFAPDVARVLSGAKSPEGRYHRDGQGALYVSPTPEFSRIAVDAYLREGDPPRVIVPLFLEGAKIADLRDPLVQKTLGLTGTESGTPWQPERKVGLPATSWVASDAARSVGADGIIYAARSAATRWHIVLFRWNGPLGPRIKVNGAPIPF